MKTVNENLLSPKTIASLDQLTDMARVLSDHVIWQARTVHSAYHQDIKRPWQTCPRDVCASTMYVLAKVTGDEPPAP